MKHNKKTKEGTAERVALLRRAFPEIEQHLVKRPPRVGADDGEREFRQPFLIVAPLSSITVFIPFRVP